MNSQIVRLEDLKIGDKIDNGSYQISREEIIDFAQNMILSFITLMKIKRRTTRLKV
ncbi:hypothetical protein ACEN33_02880 [Ruoffia sp. FAM 24228]|uniref:hypothetical protein n=1 Tax=Ruoffia sp. FAM 24228 TaxID=3259517 RepID=UPI0038857520